jgi:hypothetical protein
MAPTYPSAQELQVSLNKIAQLTTYYDTQAQRLVQAFYDKQQSDDQVAQKMAEYAQVRYAHERTISERYDTWWKSRWGHLAEPDLLSRHFDMLVHIGDPYTPPSGEEIVLAFEVLWWYQERALVLPLIREVIAFLRMMGQDVRLSINQRKKARDIIRKLFDPILPKLNKGGPSSGDPRALLWLGEMLKDYESELAKIQGLFMAMPTGDDPLSVLQKAYPHIPCEELDSWVRQAQDSREGLPRRDRIAVALVTRKYKPDASKSTRKNHSGAFEATHKDILRARTARERQRALQTRPQQVEPAVRTELIQRWHREKTERDSS